MRELLMARMEPIDERLTGHPGLRAGLEALNYPARMDSLPAPMLAAVLILLAGSAALGVRLVRERLRARFDALESRLDQGEATHRNLQAQLDGALERTSAQQRHIEGVEAAIHALQHGLEGQQQRIQDLADEEQRRVERQAETEVRARDMALQLEQMATELGRLQQDLRRVHPRLDELERERRMRAELAHLHLLLEEGRRNGAYSDATATALGEYLRSLEAEIGGAAS